MKIFKNGKFHSFDSENAVYEALVVENEKIIFVGSTEEVLKNYGDKAEEIVDFEGKTIVPGFNDSHNGTYCVVIHNVAIAAILR